MLYRMLCILSMAAAFTAIKAEKRQTLGTITTPEPFIINRVQVPTAGVASWPLTSGDEIKTGNGAAIIRFEDKTQIALDKGSTIRIEKVKNRITATLTAGSMRYKLAPNSHIDLFAAKERLKDLENGVAVKERGIERSRGIGPPLDPPGPPPEKPPERSLSY